MKNFYRKYYDEKGDKTLEEFSRWTEPIEIIQSLKRRLDSL